MSQADVNSIEQTLQELERRIYAAIGKALIGIFLSVITITGIVVKTWNASDNRISALESWRVEREKPIEDYYKFKEELASTLADIKANQRTNTANIEKILNKLDAIK